MVGRMLALKGADLVETHKRVPSSSTIPVTTGMEELSGHSKVGLSVINVTNPPAKIFCEILGSVI